MTDVNAAVDTIESSVAARYFSIISTFCFLFRCGEIKLQLHRKVFVQTKLSIAKWKMDDFESVYLQDDFSGNPKRLCPLDRLKIGEIFQVRQNQFVFVCIHCTQEFQQFARFTAHIQSHYHSALQWVAPENDTHELTLNAPQVSNTNAENIEWLFSDSSNNSTCEDDDDSQHLDVECKVSIREGLDENDDTEIINDSFENEEPVSLETRFKLKHPLIKVNDTSDTRKLLPYFSKKFSFKRTADQRFKCPLCDCLAISKANIREHVFTHSELKMFSCKLCSKDFSRPRNIIIHIEQKHSDVAVLTPDRVPKKLKIEKIDNIGNASQPNVLLSSKVKMNAKILYSHDVNGDKSRSQCFICMKTFSRPNGIVKHMKTHTQEKNYQCFTCGSQFSRSDHLSRHMLIHEEPKFKCDICDMTFRRSDKMLLHRRKHPETMNYTCENCGLGFMELSSIKTHVNFHCKGKTDVKDSINDLQMNYDDSHTDDGGNPSIEFTET